MDRLTSLSVFGQVVECGGFSAAGRKLNMSVAAVSHHIQSLEERLGVRLLNRTTRKVSLTEIGKAYYERSHQILLDLEEADRIAESLHAAPRGWLKIYSNSHLVPFLTPIISEYLHQYPDVSIQLTSGQHMVDLIELGLDLALVATPPPDSTLVARRLSPWRHILCCGPAYTKKLTGLKEPDDLAHYNCLQYAFYPYGDEWRFDGPNGQPVKTRVSGNVISDNGEMLRTLTLEGHGVVLAPSFLVADDVKTGRLVPLLPDYRPVDFAFNAIFPHRHHLSSKVRVFIDFLGERFDANPGARAQPRKSK
jgi:DNA-binding transcriptional LysR family regulator